MSYNTDRLIDEIAHRGVIPASQILHAPEDVLMFASGIIRGEIVPLVKSLRQEYFVRNSYVPFVANQEEYEIPYRSVGRTLRDVLGVSYSNGLLTEQEWDLPQIEEEYVHLWKNGDKPLGFVLRGDRIVPLPMPTSTNFGLKLVWFMSPSDLCQVSDAAVVVSVSGNDVVCSAVPGAIQTGSLVDMVAGRPGYHIHDFDLQVTNKDGNTLTFTSLPARLAAGDWITPAGWSPVVMLPDDVFPLLVSMTCQRILRSTGDEEGARSMDPDIAEQKKGVKLNLQNRVEGEPQKIVNRDGLLRRGGMSRRFMFRTTSP